MLLPCPSCKKPVFVSGSMLAAGSADVQCSHCTALLKIHPHGAADLIEGYATETGEAPDLLLPEASAPVETELSSPIVSSDPSPPELDETNTRWREPATRIRPTASEIPPPDTSEPSVSEPAKIAAEPGTSPLQDPPADWPVDPAPSEVTFGEEPVGPEPLVSEPAWSEAPVAMPIEVRPPPPPPEVARSTPSELPQTAEMPTLPDGDTPAAATKFASPPPAPGVHRGDATAPPEAKRSSAVAKLRGTSVVEVTPDRADAPDSPPPPPELPPVTVVSESLENLVPDFVFLTVDPSYPRWDEEEEYEDEDLDEDEEQLSGRETLELTETQELEPLSPPQPSTTPQVIPLPSAHETPSDEEPEPLRSGNAGKVLAVAAILLVVLGVAAVVASVGDESRVPPAAAESHQAPSTKGGPENETHPADDTQLDDRDIKNADETAADEEAEEPSDTSDVTTEVNEESVESTDTLNGLGGSMERESARAPVTKPKTKAKRRASVAPAPSERSGPVRAAASSRESARAEELYVQGNRLLRQEKVALAIGLFKECVKLDPRHGGAFRSLGVSYMKLGQERSAINAYRRFVELSPTHRDADKVRQIIVNYQTR